MVLTVTTFFYLVMLYLSLEIHYVFNVPMLDFGVFGRSLSLLCTRKTHYLHAYVAYLIVIIIEEIAKFWWALDAPTYSDECSNIRNS